MNKASGGDGIPVELFQILKDDAGKVLHSICQQIWKTQQWPQDWKRSVFINPKEMQYQRMFKLPHNFSHLTRQQTNAQNSPSQTSIVYYQELPDVQSGFRKSRGTKDQIVNISQIIKKFCFIDYSKAFYCMDHNKLWKILKEMGIPDHLTCLLRNLHASQEGTV